MGKDLVWKDGWMNGSVRLLQGSLSTQLMSNFIWCIEMRVQACIYTTTTLHSLATWLYLMGSLISHVQLLNSSCKSMNYTWYMWLLYSTWSISSNHLVSIHWSEWPKKVGASNISIMHRARSFSNLEIVNRAH